MTPSTSTATSTTTVRPVLPPPEQHPAAAPPADRDTAVQRRLSVGVTGGLDGVLRVVTLLRSRGYTVTDLAVDLHDGVPDCDVTVTVRLTAAGFGLLVERLKRMPAVMAVHRT